MRKTKKTIFLLAGILMTVSASAQMQRPTDQMLRELRQTVQKRDISQRHLSSNITQAPATKDAVKKSTGMPNDSFWFPGEWEEVQAIVVTPYYYYMPDTNFDDNNYYSADPMVTGYGEYLKYSNTQGWQSMHIYGPYTAEMDIESNFGQVAFYLMDAIQKGGAEAWVRVENFSDSAIVLQHLSNKGLRHDNIRFLEAPGNSFWYRDCGPICFYYGEGDTVGMLDFEYYPGRALDDSLPVFIERQFGLPNFTTMIEWEGGNCLVDGAGMVFSSDAIYSNNADTYGQYTWDGSDPESIHFSSKRRLSNAQVRDSLRALIGPRATYILPAFQYDGGTGHVDLYADMFDENRFVFSIMPDNYSSWTDYRTGTRNMDSLCSYRSVFDRNYYATGIPFPSKNNGSNFSSQSEYNRSYTRTYSNHTFVNNLIIQPCFSAVGADGMPTAQWDRDNIELVKQAYPGYTIYCVDVREFDGSGGAIHCITKQIPAEHPIRILHPDIHGNYQENGDAAIHTLITNVDHIANAKVVYRVAGGEWQESPLTAGANNSYDGTIPTTTFTYDDHATVEYYISATSTTGKTITKPMTALQGGYYKFNIGTPVGIASVEEMEQNFGQFYPNPASEQASLSIDLGDGQYYTVTIIDNSGRTIHTSSLNAAGHIDYTIQASRLASGVYNVVFSNGDSRIVRRLIVK